MPASISWFLIFSLCARRKRKKKLKNLLTLDLSLSDEDLLVH